MNFHLSRLAPELAGEAGAAFERERFAAKLASGVTSLQKTELWLGGSVPGYCRGDTSGQTPGAAAAAAASGLAVGDLGPAEYEARRRALAGPAGGGGHESHLRGLVRWLARLLLNC